VSERENAQALLDAAEHAEPGVASMLRRIVGEKTRRRPFAPPARAYHDPRQLPLFPGVT